MVLYTSWKLRTPCSGSTVSSRIHALSFSLAHTWYACLNCEMAISLMPCSRIFCADCSNTSSTVIFSVRFRSSANIPIVYSRGASFANHPADVCITGVSGVGGWLPHCNGMRRWNLDKTWMGHAV